MCSSVYVGKPKTLGSDASEGLPMSKVAALTGKESTHAARTSLRLLLSECASHPGRRSSPLNYLSKSLTQSVRGVSLTTKIVIIFW